MSYNSCDKAHEYEENDPNMIPYNSSEAIFCSFKLHITLLLLNRKYFRIYKYIIQRGIKQKE